ncbi:MAG: hypothetical protein HY905_24360 [Deltaproteobacteria bacterium]|nr:hypothetical protein [Deltaproteobacteria bacterium]
MTRLSGWWIALGLLASTAAGCGAIEYSVYILQAHEAIAEAEVAGAGPAMEGDECGPEQEGVSCWLAPYEYTYALEHLRKAREEVGQADYQAAVEMARAARDFARKARDMAAQLRREAGRE